MFKFNNGNGAIVCDGCGTIMKANVSLSDYRKEHTGYDFCKDCMKGIQEVDNFKQISEILEFNNQDEFYFVQIIQRKKDGNMTQIGNNGYRTVKTYYIYSVEQLLKKQEKIKELCIRNNARAYISLNRRNAQEVALHAIQEYAKLVSEGNAYQGYRVYDSCCGQCRASGYKPLWIVDVDSKDETYKNQIIEVINKCRGAEDNKIKHIIPTLHGFHLITIGFDLHQFSQLLIIEKLTSPDVHKDNPTLLYYATM